MSAWRKINAWLDLRAIWFLRRLWRHPTSVQTQAWDDLEHAARQELSGE